MRIGLGSALTCLLVPVVSATRGVRGETGRTLWVDDSHADFSRGHLSASGRNFYITAAGSLKQVSRYDLNEDGWADLLFNSAHDFILAPPVRLVDLTGEGARPAGELPGVGARQLKTGDFDADGRTDVLLLEASRWVNTRNYLHVYWGTESGTWDQAHATDLLAEDAMDVEVLDWDRDGNTDIVVLLNADNSLPGGTARRTLRAYWGGPNGFLQGDTTDLAAPEMDEIERLADAGPLLALAGNGTMLSRISIKGRQDLVAMDHRFSAGKIGNLRVCDSNSGPLILASSEAGGHSQQDPTTSRASAIWSRLVRIELADDGSFTAIQSPPLPHSEYFWSSQRPDLLLTAEVSKADNSARLLTGFDVETMQFEASRDFPEPGHVSGVALATAGAHPVVAFATFRTEESYDTESWIFPLEDAVRGSVSSGSVAKVPTHGATAIVEIRPGGADAWAVPRLAFLNRIGGSYVESLPTVIQWGSRRGFSPENRLDIPFYSGIIGAASDLDDDSRPDLVLVSQVHNVHSPKPYMGFHVYAGRHDHAFSNATILEEYGVRGLSLADVDRDGWIDLVGSVLNGPLEHRGWVLWRGGVDGFSRSRREFLAFPLAHGLPAIADTDGDGWLDVAVPSMRGNEIRIYRNDHGRFEPARFDSLPAWQANQLGFADMNADGHIDLVSASGLGPGTFFRDYGIQIFWGGPDGYHPKQAQRLPAHGAVGFLIQDWDRDGHLDLFAPNYHSGITREGTAARIYWGSANGLDSGQYTYLPVDAAAGAFAMDFNDDGMLDIAISSHTTDGSHHTQSPVYYNTNGRFGEPQAKVLLPTVGPQQMYSSGAGDQYSRTLHEWFESALIPLDGCENVRISASGTVSSAATLRFSLRTAATEADLADAVWQESNPDEWHPVPAGSRVLQYRVDFQAGWRDGLYPQLDRVEIQGR